MELNILEDKMKKAIEHLEEEYSTIRAGRANPAILNKVQVEYYGALTPINQVGSISVPEARQILITPWDRTVLSAIEKAIKEEIGVAEPSVIIIHRPCVLLKGKGPNSLVYINQDKCRACGICAKIGCPAIVFKGSKVPIINENLCNGCLVCVQVCQFGALGEVK